MPSVLVRSRRLATALVLATSSSALAGCSLSGDSTLPAYTDPVSVTYATSTGVTIATMTRVNQHVYTQDVSVGTGRTVVPGDSISVYYTGKLAGGFRFDSLGRPSAPFGTVLDSVRLIKGWVAGLAGAKVGGVRRMVVGPESAYQYSTVRDQAGNIVIPPNSVLVFDVEVVNALARP